MKPAGTAKLFILAFLLALAGYLVFYPSVEYWRARNGPWRVAFTTGPANVPKILIDQPSLAITNVQITFPAEALAEKMAPVSLLFDQPQAVPYAVPFGNCVFMDTTFLPGTVTLQVFGHEIELLPRVLVIDRQEYSWRPNSVIALQRRQAAPGAAKP